MQRWHPLPAAVYSLVEQTPGTVLLETAPGTADHPTSRLFLSPTQILTPRTSAELRELFAHIDHAQAQGAFAAGFLSYECGSHLEPSVPALTSGEPLAWFGIYAQCYEFDHLAGAFRGSEPPGLRTDSAAAAERGAEEPGVSAIELGLGEAAYRRKIEAIHEWIRRGDVYQLNFTFPIRFQVNTTVGLLYQTLRLRQPVAYGAFVHGESGRCLLSFSPELFFRIDEHDGKKRIVTRPMKGTARRGRTNAEDDDIARWLRQDAKNRSENVMIVDLLRNDLGRLCRFGTVQAENLFQVERHDTLWQMTSTVQGELRPQISTGELLRALFPSGSVTGAPKVRAMQLLAELESEPRGVYTGAIGYFSSRGAEFNVAIRTIEVEGQTGRMGIGSGIVIDSDAAAEYRECQLKAEFLTRTTPEFELIESLLWKEGYPLLELHLDRLQDSARYFGFACDRGAVRALLQEGVKQRQQGTAYKVRLLLQRDGEVRIEAEALADAGGESAEPVRIAVADARTNPADRFLFHKTTHRTRYAKAWQKARTAGCDEVLFLNEREEVTEGAISNVFIEKNGFWNTPPIACGVLPGVYRRYLLETRPEIEERPLFLDDLKQADAVYLTNAVRGLRRAVIDWDVKLELS